MRSSIDKKALMIIFVIVVPIHMGIWDKQDFQCEKSYSCQNDDKNICSNIVKRELHLTS